ncbi:MAG: class I SAM-dependent methyltransferase [Ferruginibacter sp.]|nr:class I SAM-dependent methyltransferase [Ferruginibacter sp.]
MKWLKSLLKKRGGNYYTNTVTYWEKRYANGGHSGSGSYGENAEYKATFLNTFVQDFNIDSVIEFGSGDGHQLSLARYPQYIGLDVSVTAIKMCMQQFSEDNTKSFFLYHPATFKESSHLFKSDLALSLDVIYHLMEDELYHQYMSDLFNTARQYVIIYAYDVDEVKSSHVRHRKFSSWIDQFAKEWQPLEWKVAIKKPSGAANFYIYIKLS